MDKTPDTICAVILSDTIQSNEYNLDGDDNSETLDTEHDVFADFISKGDDPSIDVLDLIQIEGSPALRKRIRTVLEKYRPVFATSLPSEPAKLPPFELIVDKERW
jgi:hypothetical protein